MSTRTTRAQSAKPRLALAPVPNPRSGLRLLATDQPVDLAEPVCAGVFEWLGEGPSYCRLCELQMCFNARLTPKPWRCGAFHPHDRWPLANEERAQSFQKWQAQYLAAANNFATYRLLDQLGSGQTVLEFKELLVFHDELTRATSGLPLA